MSFLLPELHHSAGEVRGVCDAVVGVAAVCVPRIATSLPWQILKIKGKQKNTKKKKKKKKKSHRQLFSTWTTLPPLGPILSGCRAANTVILFGTLRFHAFLRGVNASSPNAFINTLCRALIMWERK